MRRGTWILAISGVLALNNGVSYSADPLQGLAPVDGQRDVQARSRQGAAAGMPSRYTRGAAAPEKATAKNYYDDLFGGDAKPAAPTSPAAWETDGPIADAHAKDVAKEPAVAKDSAKTPVKVADPVKVVDAAAGDKIKPAAADARVFAPAVRGAKPVPGSTTESKVIQAGYDRQPNSAERKMIQQVRSEASPKRAAPMPDFGSAAEPAAPPAAPGKSAMPAARTSTVDNGPQTPQVTIEWVKKGDVSVGQECQLELHVKNSGQVPAAQVAVDGVFPNTVRLTSAEPKPAVSGEKVTWSFDSLAPGAEQTITVKMIPSRRGDIGATAHVRFTGSASASFRVEEPLLKLAMKGASEVTLGDPAPQMIMISNPGTGTAHNVKLEARLSDGLEHRTPGERLVIEVGSISPGETQSVRLPLSAVKGGAQSISVTATSSSDASATASTQLNVIAPSLKIAIEGPALRYKGRHAKYALTVTNDGSVPNNNVRISHSMSDGFKFVSADRNGKYEPSTRNVQWFIGRMEPGQTVQVACELCPMALGDFTHTVSVLSDSGVRAEAKTQTRVEGVASLTMELVDLDDPVEIGAETAYEIRVKNEGSKAATGVSIACELPPDMELKNVKAPVDAIVEGRQILFKSLDQIAAGSEAIYRVHVKGIQEGNHRMRVRMTAASLQEPIVREEATRVYADSK